MTLFDNSNFDFSQLKSLPSFNVGLLTTYLKLSLHFRTKGPIRLAKGHEGSVSGCEFSQDGEAFYLSPVSLNT